MGAMDVHLDSDVLAALTDAAERLLGRQHPLVTSLLLAAAGDLGPADIWREIEALPDDARRIYATAFAEVLPAFAGPAPGTSTH